ncbi:MAG TPA: DUF4097 family beta strand repeat-containing protein [Gaiellaceae bacterium]|nr:DUF4097 family beta strand repeat-containing protein [Gaiellaceae bacterium]
MRSEAFHTPGAPSLAIRVPSGSVEIETLDGDETRIDLEGQNEAGRAAVERATIACDGDEVRVEVGEERAVFLAFRSPKVRLRVTCPHGTRLTADVVAADVKARGRFGAAAVKTVSGDVELGDVDGDLDLKTVSGDAVAGRVGGDTRLKTVSGDLKVRELGERADGKTVSGDVELGTVSRGTVSLQSVSGDVKVGIAAGAAVWMDLNSLSGDTRCDLTPSDGPGDGDAAVEVRAKSVSGDIRLVRA